MKKILSVVFAIMLFVGVGSLGLTNNVHAGYVRGYYKSNGTYVQPHYRSNPNALKYDNYSYRGGSLYNSSYTSPTKSYTNSWYTPTYRTQSDYYTGLNYYNTYGGGSYYNWSF